MKNIFFVISALILLFAGCSTKEVYEPKKVVGEWDNVQEMDEEIVDKTADVAQLENSEVLWHDTVLHVPIEKDYRVVGKSSGYVLTTDIDGHLKLYNLTNKETTQLDLEKTVAAASTDGDVVAVVFASGKLGLYSLKTKKLLYKLEGATSIALDARIVNPYFMNDLVLFMTLDGKVVIVNKKLKKRLRTIIISATEFFNNVIYFDIVSDKLIVATSTKILSFGSSTQRIEYEPREIIHDDSNLYVATKQGDILLLSPNLEMKKKVHFSFAHFLGLALQDKTLYALEKEGYLIALSKDLLTYKVYDVDLPDESYVYPGKSKFFVGDEAVILQSDANSSK